jgi:hypothetical protein
MDDKNLARELVGAKPEKKETSQSKAKKESSSEFTRNITVLGLGDGGCKISSDIGQVTDAQTIGFNLSKRNENLFNLDKFISAEAQDGSGKNRKYAKEIVSTPKVMNTIVQETLTKRSDIYLVTQSTGGGTGCGSGPKVAATMADELSESSIAEDREKPVIVLGVYPKLSDDEASIYNTIQWQSEVEKIQLPYMIYNNARVNGSLSITHDTVNEEIVSGVRILSGMTFKQTDISSMDSKDFINLINREGRLNVYYTNRRPKQNENLDEFIINLINHSTQEPPLYPVAYALLVKGPRELLEGLDEDLSLISSKYGEPSLKYKHIEESSDVEIAFITSGSQIPKSATDKLKTRYDEIKYARKSQEDVVLAADEIDDPFAKKDKIKRGSQI